MESFLIKGGVPLHGEVAISGSKNAALPIMAATLLTDEPCVIRDVPDLSDTRFMAQILQSLGAQVKLANGTLTVHAKKIRGYADYELVRKMRGSICIAGPLLARLKKARISLPGGCIIGARPINLHLKGFEALGAKIKIEGGYVDATAKKLVGSTMFLGGRAGSTVLGTANVMMAATLADGVTVIESAACEPEVVDLAHFLNAMGAKISGAGGPTITISGVEKLHGAEHEVIPDRIETATFAIAAAATNGEVTIKNCRADHLRAVIDKLNEAGVSIQQHGGNLVVRRGKKLKSVDITTLPYSGFPTDVQAQMMSLLALHARQRTGAARRGDRDRGAERDREGRPAVERRAGDGERFARERGAGDRRAGGQGRDAGEPHLSSGSRLRKDGREIAEARRTDSARGGKMNFTD
jgi:UDP-N-acetylglucosamine 1-carboxyvinyltransferase